MEEKSDKGSFVCQICFKAFNSQVFLTIHENIHKETFKCDVCEKWFIESGDLDKHKKIHATNDKLVRIHRQVKVFRILLKISKYIRVINLKKNMTKFWIHLEFFQIDKSIKDL